MIVPGLGPLDFAQQEDSADAAEVELRRRLIAFLDFEPGALFVDEAGKLSFYQFVRIHRRAEFEAFCNEQAPALLLANRSVSPETAALHEKALRDGAKWVTIDGAGFRVRRPLSDADHRTEQNELWSEVLRELAEAVQRGSQKEAMEQGVVQTLRDNDFAIVRHHDATEYFFGTQGSEKCDYRFFGRAYKDNLLVALTAEKEPPPVAKEDMLAKQFAEFRMREARLPPAYAEFKQAAKWAGNR